MTTQDVADSAMRVAERFGVPVVLLAAMLWMAREAATSIHKTVLIPVVQSHTEFLHTTQETLSEIGAVQRQQAETLQELAIGQAELRRAVSPETRNVKVEVVE